MGGIPRAPNFLEEKRLWKKDYGVVIGVDEVGRGAFAGPIVAGAVCFYSSFRSGIISNSTSEESLRASRFGPPSEVFLNRDRRRLGLERYLKKIGVNDSKVLRPKKREELAREIKKIALGYSVASSSVGEINRLGIKKATERAFRKAVARLLDHDLPSYGVSPCEGSYLGGVPVKLRHGAGMASPRRNVGIQPSTVRGAHNPKSLKFGNSKTYVLVDAFYIKYLRRVGLKNQKAIKKGDKKSLSIAAASILAKVHRDRLMKRLSKKYVRYHWSKNKGYGTWEHRKAILRYGLTRLHRKSFVRKTIEKVF